MDAERLKNLILSWASAYINHNCNRPDIPQAIKDRDSALDFLNTNLKVKNKKNVSKKFKSSI